MYLFWGKKFKNRLILLSKVTPSMHYHMKHMA